MEKEIMFQYQTKVGDMYRFLMHHAYIGVSGIINLVISIGALVLLFTGAGGGQAFSNLMLILIASLFTIINPILLFYKAAKQVKLTPMFQKPIDYFINEEGILVSQGEEKILINWTDIWKAVETNHAFYFYLSTRGAYILPKAALPGHAEELKKLVIEHAPEARKKFKK